MECFENGDFVFVRTDSCQEDWINESLIERVAKLKGNMYMTEELWNRRFIKNVSTGEWYSYQDIYEIINS